MMTPVTAVARGTGQLKINEKQSHAERNRNKSDEQQRNTLFVA